MTRTKQYCDIAKHVLRNVYSVTGNSSEFYRFIEKKNKIQKIPSTKNALNSVPTDTWATKISTVRGAK